jgi:23S rRNA pseudouridine955/2504/2580 synthase
MIVDHDKGKQAITEYKILDKVSSRVGLIALFPKTGRTHQLRVHLENINAPIVGDKKYNGLLGVYSSENDLSGHENISQIKWSDKDIKNLQLHAYSIRMPSNEVIEAELSENFKKNLKFLGLTLPKNINNLFI